MNTPDRDTLLLERLLERYRFVQPVPPSVQESILASRKRILVRVLKSVGAFSAVYGAFLTAYFAVKKIGSAGLFAKFIISGVAVASISYGGYYAATNAVRESKIETVTAPPPSDSTAKHYRWVDRITLFNGRVIMGAIISRGQVYEILTERGVIHVPGNQIKRVTPVRVYEKTKQEPEDSGNDDPRR